MWMPYVVRVASISAREWVRGTVHYLEETTQEARHAENLARDGGRVGGRARRRQRGWGAAR